MSGIDDPSRPTLDYASQQGKRKSSIWFGKYILIGLFLVLPIAFFFLFIGFDSRVDTNRVGCASNLRQIGQAITIYSYDNHDEYPDTLATLLQSEELLPRLFVCPESNDTEATGPTTQAIAANLTAGGHLSYIYLGHGWKRSTTPANAVVVYEPLSNSGGEGMEVLFGDGHVNWVTAKDAAKILANAIPGGVPVTMPGH